MKIAAQIIAAFAADGITCYVVDGDLRLVAKNSDGSPLDGLYLRQHAIARRYSNVLRRHLLREPPSSERLIDVNDYEPILFVAANPHTSLSYISDTIGIPLGTLHSIISNRAARQMIEALHWSGREFLSQYKLPVCSWITVPRRPSRSERARRLLRRFPERLCDHAFLQKWTTDADVRWGNVMAVMPQVAANRMCNATGANNGR